MSREGLGYGFAGALTEDDAGEDTEGAESVNGISGGSISWLAEGGYHVGGYGEVHCPGVGRLFAFELGEPVAGGICQTLVVRGIAVRNAGFAIASAADGETPVTWSEVGVGVRRGVPEEGEVVREISREGERVDTLIWLYGRSHGAYKATGGDDRAVGQADLPVVVVPIAHYFLAGLHTGIPCNDGTLSSRLVCQVRQQGEWVYAPFVGQPEGGND